MMPDDKKVTLCEEIILLTISDEGRFLRSGDHISVRAAVAGACLMDLALLGRIDNDLKNLFIANDTVTGEPHLDRTLAALGVVGSTVTLTKAVEEAFSVAGSVYGLALKRLVQRGIIERRDEIVFWVMKSRRYPAIDNTIQVEARQKIFNILNTNEVPDPTEAALVSLAYQTGILPLFMSDKDIDRVIGRVRNIAKLDITLTTMHRLGLAIEAQVMLLSTPNL